MASNVQRSQQSGPGNAAVRTALAAKEAGVRRAEPSAAGASAEAAKKASGYGLPCAKCHLYYPADLDSCPTCHHKERVSPNAPKLPVKMAQARVDPVPDSAAVEQEREEFLRQFKSQLMQAHATVVSGGESVCSMGEHHTGEAARAEVCKTCYERLQERLDVFEAALHLDVKEAAQIIYDAVWADPSDPSKTYQNAASALLAELRKRAGINSVLSPFQPLSH